MVLKITQCLLGHKNDAREVQLETVTQQQLPTSTTHQLSEIPFERERPRHSEMHQSHLYPHSKLCLLQRHDIWVLEERRVLPCKGPV